MMQFEKYDIEAEIIKINQTKLLHNDLDWYGARKCIHTIYGIPKWLTLDAYPFHAIYVADHEHSDYSLQYKCPVLATRETQSRHLVGLGRNPDTTFASGSLFARYRQVKGIEKDPLATGTLLYLAHSSRQVRAHNEIDLLIAKLRELPEEFHPVNVCIYWVDFERITYKKFLEAGMNVYTAGHACDPDFVDNFYEILRHHKYAMANSPGGSNNFYCVEMGIPFFTYAEETSINYAEITEFFYEAQISIEKSQEFTSKHEAFLIEHFPHVPTLAIDPRLEDTCNKLLGLDSYTPDEIIRKSLVKYAVKHTLTTAAVYCKCHFKGALKSALSPKMVSTLRDIKTAIKSFLAHGKEVFREKKEEIIVDYSGIQDLGADKDFYYGEIPKYDFGSILNAIREGTDKASSIIDVYCEQHNNEYFKKHALSNNRSMCLELFGDLKGKTVLDYGCGLGAIGIEAARRGAQVTFADSCWPRLQMASYLLKEVDLHHEHTFLAASDINKISEIGKKYDLILLNGVLEWIPSTSQQTFNSALTSQLQFLKTCKGMLTQDGCIFLAMENRYSLIYQLGYPEDHTNIKGISLLDRVKGNELHKKNAKKDFVNLTWSYEDYFEQGRAIGLAVEKITGVFPDYRFPECIVDLEGCAPKTLVNAMMLEAKIFPEINDYTELLTYIGRTDALKHFVYSYGVVLKNHRD